MLSEQEISDRIARVEPQHAAILPSEMLMFCEACLRAGVTYVIESGRRYGYSTEVLCQFPEWRVTSIESGPEADFDQRLRKYDQLKMVTGYTQSELSSLWSKEPTAVLLDGPKGMIAYEIFKQNRGRAVVWAIHDAHVGTPIREAMIAEGATLTDRFDLLQRWGHLDHDSLRYRGYTSHGELLPYGSVLAIVGGAL